MNADHAALCSSPEWAASLECEVLAPLLTGVDLGREMAEFGPGPGAATSWLAPRVARLTVVEVDAAAAQRLAARTAGNVAVVVSDCSTIGLRGEAFDSVGSFTMLHHLSTPQVQYAALSEAFRLLRPGGLLVGSDSIASSELHAFHADDTYNPIDPARLLVWLQTLGYARITIAVDQRMTFRASKPEAGDPL